MTDLQLRMRNELEPILTLHDPRQKISAYHDMPCAIFRYDPEDEFALRNEATLLETRLTQAGKRVHRISLAECLEQAMRAQHPLKDWFQTEREQGTESLAQTVHAVLSDYAPSLVDLVASRMPEHADPHRDIIFILRTGALFPFYRAHTLLEQLHGRVSTPTVLFYPGTLDGKVGLKFMGVLDADPNYRPKII